MNLLDINIETLILVAVWDEPLIFQGCFKISTLHFKQEEYFFFRYEARGIKEIDIIEKDFSPSNYQLTHLYTPSKQIAFEEEDEDKEHAFYILKYAFHITIKEMLLNQAQKKQVLSIDEVVFDSLIEKIKPMMDQQSLWSEQMKEIGFAVTMDFTPQEKMGEFAVKMLLSNFENQLYKNNHH